MKVVKKELGWNVLLDLDFENYKKFLDDVKKLGKKYESYSNPDKLNYGISCNFRKSPNMNARGWSSRVIDKSGKISECVFLDYDNILFSLVENELKYIQKKHNLTPFYVLKTSESKKAGGEVYGNYLCVSLTKKNFGEARDIIMETHCDSSFKLVPQSYAYRTWVHRLSRKGKKNAPQFKCVIGDLKKEYVQEISETHLNLLSELYDLPKIKYKNKDGGQKIFLSEYLTASK